MRGIKQFLDLVWAATFDHVDPNKRHMSSSSIARFQPRPLAPIATFTDSAYSIDRAAPRAPPKHRHRPVDRESRLLSLERRAVLIDPDRDERIGVEKVACDVETDDALHVSRVWDD